MRRPELSAATYRQMAYAMKGRGKTKRETHFLNEARNAYENPLPAKKSGVTTRVPMSEWGGAGNRWDYGSGGASYALATGKRNPGDSSNRAITQGGGKTPTRPPRSGGTRGGSTQQVPGPAGRGTRMESPPERAASELRSTLGGKSRVTKSQTRAVDRAVGQLGAVMGRRATAPTTKRPVGGGSTSTVRRVASAQRRR